MRRLRIVLGSVALLALAGGLAWRLLFAPPADSQSAEATTARNETPAARGGAADEGTSSAVGVPAPDAETSPAPRDATRSGDLGGGFERALQWSQVDLEALRRELPDNLYWEMGAPTDDPRVTEERARERARWNEAWGRVLAGQASEQEIEDYYAHRQRLSSDYIEFASTLLERHGETLPERDAALLGLVVEMHHKRLQELPRAMAEALERKQEQDALREAWLAEEERFATPGRAADSGPGSSTDTAPD